MAHAYAPKLHSEMKNNSQNTTRGAGFNAVAAAGFGAVTMASLAMRLFGNSSPGLSLSGYSDKDQLATGAHIALAVGAYCAYPHALIALRDEILDNQKVRRSANYLDMLKLILRKSERLTR